MHRTKLWHPDNSCLLLNSMKSLKTELCTPCEDAKEEHLFSKETIDTYLSELDAWHVDPTYHFIFKEYTFQNFVKALGFIEQVADIAEEVGHHPDIHIWYNKVRLELSTHSVGGITKNDFIVASRIDGLLVL